MELINIKKIPVLSRTEKIFLRIKCSLTWRKNEVGSAVVEFISLMLLLILPVITYFTLSTVKSQQTIQDKRIFREISSIMNSGTNFQESFSLAQRYLSLESSGSALKVSCLSGDCPHRESVMRIILTTPSSLISATIIGGKWN